MSSVKNQVEYRKVVDLVELADNPRTINKSQFNKLKTSIQNNPDYFEARPLILSDRTGELVVLAGNQRLKAAKALGLTEVPTVLLSGLSEEREKELIIRDNVENGEWDFDTLANEWDIEQLEDWGVEDLPPIQTMEDIVEAATGGAIKELDDRADYDPNNLIREEASTEVVTKLEEAVSAGKIHPEIEAILRSRIEQLKIFNFDELIRFYNSEDSSDEERDLLRRLYLVFITPKEALERQMLKMTMLTGDIYDDELTEKTNAKA